MIRFTILEIMFILFLHSHTEGQVVPIVPVTARPLCNYQMVLANQACAYLPLVEIHPPSPRAPFGPLAPPSKDGTPGPKHRRKHVHGHGDDLDHDHGHGHDHEHRHKHAHRHVNSEDLDNENDDDNDHGHDHDHQHRHKHAHRHIHSEDHGNENDHGYDHDRVLDHDYRHGRGRKQQHLHRHHHRHRQTHVEEQCCNWLSQVDDYCVCEILVHMPAFLARPVHKYSVTVGGACNITYSCGSRLRN